MKIMKRKKVKNRLNILVIMIMLVIFIVPSFAYASGDPVDNLTSYARERIGTVFLVIVAFYITKNIAKNATSKLIGFAIIAIIGGLLVYKPEFIQNGADWLYNILF